MILSIKKLNTELFYYKGDLWFDIGKLIHIHLSNPFKTWWKARKYFKFPDVKIKFETHLNNFPYAHKDHIGKILDINFHDVMWKDKYNSPRHEVNPFIFICLFRFLCLHIVFHKKFYDEIGNQTDGSSMYWEYILDYVYYSKKLTIASSWETTSKIYKKIVKYGENGDVVKYMNIRIPIEKYSLNKQGVKEINKLIKVINY